MMNRQDSARLLKIWFERCGGRMRCSILQLLMIPPVPFFFLSFLAPSCSPLRFPSHKSISPPFYFRSLFSLSSISRSPTSCWRIWNSGIPIGNRKGFLKKKKLILGESACSTRTRTRTGMALSIFIFFPSFLAQVLGGGVSCRDSLGNNVFSV